MENRQLKEQLNRGQIEFQRIQGEYDLFKRDSETRV